MIIGVGIDLVEIESMEKLIARSSNKALDRLLTANEQKLAASFLTPRRRAEWIAGRFAAKEAFLKALGTGIGGDLGLRDIEIGVDAFGKPVVTLSGQMMERWGHTLRCHISITHTATTAGAVMVIEKEGS